MILGSIKDGEERVKLSIDIFCIACSKRVPGGIQTSENTYHNTELFQAMLKEFREQYLCGICRDEKRRRNKKESRAQSGKL